MADPVGFVRRTYWNLINTLTVVGLVGLVWYLWLSITGPTGPDATKGLVYRLPAIYGDVYVSQTNASVLWAFACEMGALAVIGAFGRMFGPPQYFAFLSRFAPSRNGD